MNTEEMSEQVELLRSGAVGVLPTDTIYALAGSALIPDTVDRIYELKRRDANKPCIVLISDVHELEQFGVVLSEELLETLTRYWPGPYSIILPIIDDQFEYLHRGTDSIAFRIPDNAELLSFLNETGPLIVPSANIEGQKPATTIAEAKKYFGDDIDFAIDGGTLDGEPSTVLRLDEDGPMIIR